MSALLTHIHDPKVLSALLAGAIIAGIVIVLQVLLGRRVHDKSNRGGVKKFIAFLGAVAALLVISGIFGERLGQLTVGLSVIGAGVAFALQEVIASLAGWFAILFAGFYKTGDRVRVGDIHGDVIEIGMLRTGIMEIGEWIHSDLYTGRIVRVANSFVFKSAVFNYTGAFPYLWDEFRVPIRYDSDLRLAREMLQRIIEDIVRDYTAGAKQAWQELSNRYAVSREQPFEPTVTLVANDNWMEFTVRYVVDYRKRRLTQDEFFTRFVEEVNRSDGRIAIASSTFQVVAPSELAVKVKNSKAAG